MLLHIPYLKGESQNLAKGDEYSDQNHLQGLLTHSSMSWLQVSPVQPTGQLQEKLPTSSVQEPPLRQGLVAHSATSSSQVAPCQPGAQVQVKSAPWSVQLPLTH